ncbi:MAG: phosphoribosylaminoimidazolesuccinocarboxamide synthase [Flavobacteriaceae bacterium]|nr:MAG: phosphoribosylaminoimidazolesuccinocarboxamide synthase [Flavobacteriaceae bacterium]
MEDEKKFKTKTGYCHVLPDKIVLTRDGIIGNVSQTVNGNGIFRILLIYSAISIFLLYKTYSSFIKGQNLFALFFIIIAFYLIYSIIKSINNSATPIILRDKIKEGKFIKAIPRVTRSRFEILFEDEKGKIKKRIIMLPGSLNDGENETEKAFEIMKSEKIITL